MEYYHTSVVLHNLKVYLLFSIPSPLPIAPIGRPRSVVAKEGSSLDIMLEWQLPFILSTNCPIKGFIVYWNGGNVSTTKYRLKYRFTGLAPYTEYRFLVAAVTSAGVGPRSSSVYVRTRPTGKLISDVWL